MPPTPRTIPSIAIALLTSAISAQSRLPAVDPALRQRFGFHDPLVRKLAHGTNLPCAVRWTADGPLHLLVNNPHRARIDEFVRDGAGLGTKTIDTDGDLRGLCVADVDGDGKTDVLMLTSRGRLEIRLTGTDRPKVPDLEVGRGAVADSMRCADLDGDGRPDVVLLTTDGLRTVTNLRAEPRLSEPDPVFATRLRRFELFDVDGDGDADVVVFTNEDRMQVQVKLGDGKGGFGAWILPVTEPLLQAFPGTLVGKARTVAAIHKSTYRVVEYGLREAEDPQSPAPMLTALPSSNEVPAFAQGDIDGDGDPDLVLSDPERARLMILREAGGRFTVEHTPSLAGVRSLAIGDLDGDGKNDLVLASPEEATLAWVPGSGPIDAFPKRLADLPEIGGKASSPIVVTVHEGAALVIVRNKDQAAELVRVRPGEVSKSLCDLGRMPREPRRLLCAELDGRPGADLAYVAPGEGVRALFAIAGGRFEAPAMAASAGFTQRMEDGALSLTGSGGQSALLAVRERYARSFRFDAKGQPVIVSQDNGPDGNPSMAMGTVLADGTRVFVDRAANRLYRVPKSGPSTSVDLPAVLPRYLLPHGPDVVVLGSRGVLRVPLAKSWRLVAVRRHEPPTQKTRYYDGMAADLDGDGKQELALLDTDQHGVHVLVPDGAELSRGLSFPVFQSARSEDRRQEPHAMLSADLSGDGRDDLVLLCHDRVLIYYQER